MAKRQISALFAICLVTPNVHVDLRLQEPAASRPQENSQAAPSDASHPLLVDGTVVHLKFLSTVDSSRVIAGDKVPLEVFDPVFVDGILVIPRQSPAEAIVTVAQPKRTMARGGNLELRIDSVRIADGQIVPVRGVKDAKGQSREGVAVGVLAASMVVSAFPLVYIVQGKNAAISAGTALDAYIVGNIPLDKSKFQPAAGDSKEKARPK